MSSELDDFLLACFVITLESRLMIIFCCSYTVVEKLSVTVYYNIFHISYNYISTLKKVIGIGCRT